MDSGVRAHPVRFASALVCATSHLPGCEKSPSLGMLEAQPSVGLGARLILVQTDLMLLGWSVLEEVTASMKSR